MQILRSRLTGFRNLADVELEFSSGVNLFIGDNGQGKTNILEALNFLALGRSHRGAKAEELIRFGDHHLHVSLTLLDDQGTEHTYEFGLDRDGSRRIRLDGEAISRRADLVGNLSTVFFWPESIELVRGGPETRRRFADQALSGIDPVYLVALTAYQRALRQKARLLRDVQRGLRPALSAAEELHSWNEELARQAAVVVPGRVEWAKRLEPHASAGYAALAGVDQLLNFEYRPRLIAAAQNPENEHYERDILTEIDYIRPDEFRRGRPLTGPQLDDFEVSLTNAEANDEKLDLRVYGSQGETRTAAISLILAQSDVVYQQRQVRPVLFLDDIFSELDRDRARRLQERCAMNHQIFIATARTDDVDGWQPDSVSRWHVTGGELSRLS